MTNAEIIKVVQAYEDGKTVECRMRNSEQAWLSAPQPLWDFFGYDYRIKPEPPKPREWWFVKNIGKDPNRYGWTRCDVRQEGVEYLEQVHVREVLP